MFIGFFSNWLRETKYSHLMDVEQFRDLKRLKQEVISGDLSATELVLCYDRLYSNFGGFSDKLAVFDVASVVLLKLTKLEHTQSVIIHEGWVKHMFSCIDSAGKALDIVKITNFVNKVVAYVKPSGVESVLMRWLDYLVDSFSNTKEAMNLMETMVRHVTKGICEFYDSNISFIRVLFNNFSGDSAANASNKLLVSIYKNLYLHDGWFDRWSPLLQEFLLDLRCSKNLQIYFVPAIFKIDKSFFKVFLEQFTSKDTVLFTDLLRVSFQIDLDPMTFSEVRIDLLLASSDIHVRLNALDLVCFSPKSTKTIDPKVFELIQNNLLHIVMDLNSVDTRNTFINIMSAFVMRLKDSSHSQFKKLKEYSPEMHLFVEWLVDFITANLTPISTYHQASVALQLLNKLIDVDLDGLHPVNDKDNKLKFPFQIPIFTKKRIFFLLDNVHNSFEDLRNMSASVLLKCPFVLSLESTPYSIENTIGFCYSIKSRQSEGAAKYFEVLCNSYFKHNKPLEPLFDVFNNIFDNFQFNSKLPVENRIHGILTALKLMLSSLPCSYYEDRKYWSVFFNKIIDVDQIIWNHILQWLENEELEEGMSTNFCWRYVKESTEFMASMYKITSQIDTKMVSVELPAYILTLTQRIPQINHRGAVSSIYPALVVIVGYCYDVQEYHNFPDQLLKNCLSFITNRSKIITRRSGGLPSLITAILTSTKDIKGDCNDMMATVMTTLLPITTLEVSDEEKKYDLPQVNAMNCIKGVFNDSNLTTESIRFLKESLLVCLANFKSHNWSIKNCALMLFTSLKNKLFPHTKPLSLSFFTRFDIKSLLLDYLKSGDCEIVLAVLSIVSSLNFTSDEVNFLEFKPILVALLDNPSWKVREMSADAIANILQPNQYEETIVLLTGTAGTRNFAHGSFLTVQRIVQKDNNPRRFSNVVLPLIDQLQWSTVKPYVEMIRFMDVPDSYNVKLSMLFINNMTTEYDGIKRLSLNALLEYLLETHCSEDLIQLVIDINIDFKEIVLNYLATKRDVDVSVIWKLLQEKDTLLVLQTLAVLEKYPPVEGADLSSLLSLTNSSNKELSTKSISLLSYYDYQYAKRFWKDIVTQVDSESESVRSNCLSCIVHYMKQSPNTVSMEFLFTLFKFVTDEDDVIKSKAITALSSTMNLPQDYPSYKLVSLFSHFVVSLGTKNTADRPGIAQTAADHIINYAPSAVSKVNLYLEDINKSEERFVNELDNPYRMDFVIVNKLAEIVNTFSNKDATELLVSHTTNMTNQIAEYDPFNKPGHHWNDLLYSAAAHNAVLSQWKKTLESSVNTTTPPHPSYREEFSAYPDGPLAHLCK